ncbi:unnamed protein product [Echinostoma caproni]|uniref:Secreted protein n=1 Tax=Echinostoma caproni TaxID=27848 RepID=A0A183A5G7_9TREM|nr:unnamed protein product [Echinostoma caproni]
MISLQTALLLGILYTQLCPSETAAIPAKTVLFQTSNSAQLRTKRFAQSHRIQFRDRLLSPLSRATPVNTIELEKLQIFKGAGAKSDECFKCLWSCKGGCVYSCYTIC